MSASDSGGSGAEEVLEVGEQLHGINAVVGVDVPGGLLRKGLLACPGQLTGDDFFIDGIGYA